MLGAEEARLEDEEEEEEVAASRKPVGLVSSSRSGISDTGVGQLISDATAIAFLAYWYPAGDMAAKETAATAAAAPRKGSAEM